MARFAYCSVEGSTLSWARRLVDEGNEVLYYCPDPAQRKIGRGIVPKTDNLASWLAWGSQNADTIFFVDTTKTKLFNTGEVFDKLRKANKLTVGGGSFMDRLETDRQWGEDFAKQAGILCPPTKKFRTISESIKFLESEPKQESGDGGWAWKPDKDIGTDATLVTSDTARMVEHVTHVRDRFGDAIPCIVQERIPGVALSTARWWNGRTWVGPYEGTLEEKKLMDGDRGPATGCSLNTLWFYREETPKIGEALKFDALAGLFRKAGAPPGLYDINAIVNKQGAWFLEWTPRLGIDSELTSQRGVSNLGDLLVAVATGGGNLEQMFDQDTCYHSVRLSVPPYPTHLEKDESPALGVPVKGYDGVWDKFCVLVGVEWDVKKGLSVADPGGFLGIAICADRSISKGFETLYNYLDKELKVPNIQYRTDAAKIVTKDVMDMLASGWPTTPVMKK